MPNLSPDDASLAEGGIIPFVAHDGAALIWVELRDGMEDDAAVVAPGAMTWSGVVVSWYLDEGVSAFSIGDAAALVPAQKRMIEDEVSSAPSFVRFTAAANIPGSAGAIWVYVDTSVKV